MIQTSMDSDKLEGQIENVVSAIELLYKTCLSLLTNANVNTSESKFVKGVCTPSPDNIDDDVFSLYSNTVAPVPVRAHIHPKMVGLKLLKDSKASRKRKIDL